MIFRQGCLVSACALAWLLFSPSYAAEKCEPWMARIISVQGRVEVVRTGKARWQRVKLEETLCAGDSVRIEARSRAAILLANQTVLRLDEESAITFSKIEPDKPSLLELLKGAVHFISRVSRSLEIKTPFVNAGIEGTEFVMRVGASQTEILVFEGRVRVSNTAGSLVLANGQAAVAEAGKAPVRRIIVKPRKAVQWALYYPPIIDYRQFSGMTRPGTKALRESIALNRTNDIAGAVAVLDTVPSKLRDANYFTLRAAMLLSVGRLDEAEPDIGQALDLDPDNGVAYALQSIIAVAQNEDEKALHLALRAVDLSPQSPVPQIALSYAHQALFDIEKALESVQKAVDITPGDALAWARIAELQLSLGDLDRALAAARKAADLDPGLARTQAVLGFANLIRIDIQEAQTAFKKAIELDSAAPLPRLGLGLAKIRKGDLNEGTEQIEIAASLDPDNALIRSYLGKAYYDQKRDELAAAEFETAKALDPNDPTAYFYNAILEQTSNRPVEALRDLQQAIKLNDNRAVYRSRFLLDQDLAARSASLGRIYRDLGFEQLALVEGWKSVDTDPSNFSGHRLLADSYAALPRHEIARVSELLQSQLLQPININNLQPQLAESNLQILEGGGPSAIGFNEFNPLFTRNRVALQVNGLAGNNDTFADDATVSGVKDRFSFSLGQFHYETDGFRENNDLKHDIYNVFLQSAITPKLNIQAEYRRRETEQGDLQLRFDPEAFQNRTRREIDQDTFRLGARASISPQSDLIVSGIYTDRNSLQSVSRDFPDPVSFTQDDQEGFQVEGQYLLQHGIFNATLGGGTYDIDDDRVVRLQFPFPCPFPTCEFPSKIDRKYHNTYLYTNTTFPRTVSWTVGLSYDSIDDRNGDFDKFNPKVGIQWDFTDWARLRLAYLRTVKRVLVVDQTIEPTQVAGFTQFFDDINATETELFGVGIDTILASTLYGGIEYTRRDLQVPIRDMGQVGRFDRWEDLAQAYLYWTPHDRWAISAKAEFEKFRRSTIDPSLQENGTLPEVKTLALPLFARYSNPSGFSAAVGGTFVSQKVELSPSSMLSRDSDEFYLVDAALRYRFPKRFGLFSLEVRNLFDQSFFFRDLNIQTEGEAVTPRFIPDRTVLIRLTFALN
jgi:tetratricopeptide (TPR) repeat protein